MTVDERPKTAYNNKRLQRKEEFSMSECSGNCSSCGSSCSERKAESLLAELNSASTVRRVYAVVSGKGGVGLFSVWFTP